MDWQNSSILITGGTGSFGKKFVEVMLRDFHPKRVIVFSRDELKQHEMKMDGFGGASLRYFIGDVRDKERLQRAMDGVDIVIHAAAIKQVPVCEYNPFEAVKTNVYGTQNLINAAIDTGVQKVIALSTDKAVNPVNLYGATKLCAEKIIVQGNSYSGGRGTQFSCVRYGNVIASRGSVIPVFLKQRKTGTITVTDERMTRFWITLDQAVHVVIHGLTQMQGGEIFVPKVPGMRIMDLARAVAPECEIRFIGIRPGEKLHEVLITEEEGRNTVFYNGMYIIMPTLTFWQKPDYKDAQRLPDGFVYVSGSTEYCMSVEELKQIIQKEGLDV